MSLGCTRRGSHSAKGRFFSAEQAITEGFRNLSRFARSGFGVRNEAD